MVLQDKILAILYSMTESGSGSGSGSGEDALIKTVIYGSAFDANVRLDRKPDPAAIIYLLDSWKLDTRTMMKYKECDIAIYFCKRFKLDAKGEEIKTIIDSIEPIVDDFIDAVISEKSIIVSDIKAQASYGKFDCNTCGYTLMFHVVDKQGTCFNS